MWVMLLEKAWAKIHGSYFRIIGGNSHLTFRDLTSAPSFRIDMDEKHYKLKNEFWDDIVKWDKKKYIICLGSD